MGSKLFSSGCIGSFVLAMVFDHHGYEYTSIAFAALAMVLLLISMFLAMDDL